MLMTPIQIMVIILAVALGTMFTRFLPFLLFPEKKEPSNVILFLGKALPPAMMGLLVVYCLKDISIRTEPHGIPELVGILVILIMYKWKNNVLISIASGTVVYMLLVQKVLGFLG
jgi:branched-subunit amino acid transport protein AzlD